MNKNSISKISTDEYPRVTQADFDRAVLRRNLEPDEEKRCIGGPRPFIGCRRNTGAIAEITGLSIEELQGVKMERGPIK